MDQFKGGGSTDTHGRVVANVDLDFSDVPTTFDAGWDPAELLEPGYQMIPSRALRKVQYEPELAKLQRKDEQTSDELGGLWDVACPVQLQLECFPLLLRSAAPWA